MFNLYSSSTIKEETGFEEDVLIEVYGRNFKHMNPKHVYLVYKYIHLYPKNRQTSAVLDICTTQFKEIFYKTLEGMSASIDELDYDIRLSPFNHCIHFPTRVTAMVDTFVVHVATPLKYSVAKTLWNPKYGGTVLKWQVVVDFLGNYLLLTGHHVLYDGIIFQNTINSYHRYDWELWLGDGHYIGLAQLLTPYRRDHPLTEAELVFNTILQG